MASSPPISTVYVQNLEERIKLQQLTETLRTIFSEFGNVVDIVAKKNLKAKGQAFIVFDHPGGATNAIDELQGFELFDKPMLLSLAKTQSDKTVEMNCSSEAYESHKRHRLLEKDKRLAVEAAEGERQSKRGPGPTTDVRSGKLVKPSGLKSTGPAASQVVPDEYLPPNKILFLQHIPEEYDADALGAIFDRFDGFREIRFVPGRRGIAFVEYGNEQGAIAAKENTAGMVLGETTLKVTYQRR
ncbi:hypothetical protein QQS21_003861 [Conoideocrella luteorostrata]|uniref:RRM domain-containing protein n=1 Tax=Conoideocrella luteorostrata TaxID=1105319 RepID=A0AAJ0G088_9HYPO|nr:hypothetical protein QQS21_003861 [Conoideocrella luteorostrata]